LRWQAEMAARVSGINRGATQPKQRDRADLCRPLHHQRSVIALAEAVLAFVHVDCTTAASRR
jgi:hypothetical protein